MRSAYPAFSVFLPCIISAHFCIPADHSIRHAPHTLTAVSQSFLVVPPHLLVYSLFSSVHVTGRRRRRVFFRRRRHIRSVLVTGLTRFGHFLQMIEERPFGTIRVYLLTFSFPDGVVLSQTNASTALG